MFQRKWTTRARIERKYDSLGNIYGEMACHINGLLDKE
jgi:hypothetical protein